ncbi:MAG TPA: DUF882 domain-containing protein [Caulobacteraceae bacterium]|nr:DUF882 domain-containing protein [Caulobacteraceae bacterium]
MLDRRRLMTMGLGAGVSLAAPLAAEAAAHRKAHAKVHEALRHGKEHRLWSAAARHGHKPEGLVLEHQMIRPEMERVSFGPRSITLKNLHTDETLDAVYWENGQYVPDALQAVNHVLRDFRTGDVHAIEPRLIDLITDLRTKVGSKAPFQVISGYRSPQTNAMLRELSAEVAQHSLHMDGMAIDIVLEDVDLGGLHRAALDLARGGVGYYPGRFLHVDVGPVRRWQG